MSVDIFGYLFKKISTEQFSNDYTKVKYLGDGGSGAVFLYKQTSNQNDVAIKIITEDKINDNFGLQSVKRVISEYECLLRTKDIPSIPNVHDLFVIDSNDKYSFHIVMDMIHGTSLDLILLNSENFTRFVPWLLTVLADIHDHDVIHYDIGLMNIIMDSHDNFHLIDFGEGFILTQEATIKPQLFDNNYLVKIRNCKSSPDHNSIEYIKQYDVYSIGELLYGMVMGKCWEETMSKSLKIKFGNIIKECLQWDPKARPDSKRLRQLALEFICKVIIDKGVL
jgi:serine/threonine protein kinase